MKFTVTMDIQPKDIRILVVDDEPEVHAVLDKMLSRHGYQVESAYNAEEALNSIDQNKPDVVILDIMMPQVSGMEVCNEIRKKPESKDIIILILSARDEQTDRLEGLTQGADDYISKPFHLKALIRKIEFMLEKREERRFKEVIRP